MQAFQRLEAEWAEFNQLPVEGMVCCASGTAALHLALEALELPPGSEVVTADYSMVAVPRAISMAGLSPLFVDCDDALQIDLDDLDAGLASAVTPRVVLSVHVYGRRCDMDGLALLARKYMVRVVEDLAEAHGVAPHHETDAACWSFQSSKVVHGEEGGAVWFRDPDQAALARRLRCLGFSEAWDYAHTPRGHNYRLSNAHADLICGSLTIVGRNLALRRRTVEAYDALCPPVWRMPHRESPWVYDVRIPGMTRTQQARVVGLLNAAGVAARMGFLPMTAQAEYRHCCCPGIRARLAGHEVLTLPLHPERVREGDPELAFRILRGPNEGTIGVPGD